VVTDKILFVNGVPHNRTVDKPARKRGGRIAPLHQQTFGIEANIEFEVLMTLSKLSIVKVDWQCMVLDEAKRGLIDNMEM
jgi:hypothetical protein